MPSEPGARVTRCVAWTGGAPGLPPELERVLRAKGVALAVAADIYETLARVCIARRGMDGRRGGVVLLLVEPEGKAGAGPLAVAAERFAPGAVVWVYDGAAPQRLRALTRAELDRWSGGATEPIPAHANGSPRNTPVLRLAGTPRDGESDGHEPPPDGTTTNGPVRKPVIKGEDPSDVEHGIHVALSGDELSMLLGVEPRRGRNVDGQ